MKELKSIKNKSLQLCLLACCFIYITGCGKKTASDKTVFYYNESTGIATLDPAFAKNQSIMWAIHQVYNTLVEIDSNLNIVPRWLKAGILMSQEPLILFTYELMYIFITAKYSPVGKEEKCWHEMLYSA